MTSGAVAAARDRAGATRLGVAPPLPITVGLSPVRTATTAMGGRLVLRVLARPGEERAVERDLELAAGRVRAWAAMLTRRGEDSALIRLNADPRDAVPVRPTLAAALAWAAEAADATGGIVDVALLDERLAAEGLPAAAPEAGPTPVGPDGRHPLDLHGPTRRWSLRAGAGRRATSVARAPGTRLDLDGVAKGWVADRALALLRRHPGAFVDADGDIAIRLAPGERLEVGVGDPREDGRHLAILSIDSRDGRETWGVATSGTSVHRWSTPAGTTHHLIDPRTRRPAATDVVQATVIAATAREAEAFAKAAIILGAAAGLDLFDRARVRGAILLLYDGRVVATPRTMELVA